MKLFFLVLMCVLIYSYTEANKQDSVQESKGESKNDTLTTERSPPQCIIPKTPDLLIYSNRNNRKYISWRSPCNMTTNILDFKITLNGTYSDNDSLHDNTTTYINKIRNGQYNITHAVNLLEGYIYDLHVRVHLKDGTGGEIARITSLRIPDGYPGIPGIKMPTNESKSSFIVNWSPPKEKTGRINYYRVNITSLRPLYKTKCSINNTSYLYTVNGNETTFNFTEGEPFYKYSVTISANTAKGFGNSSKEITVQTNQSIPEGVVFGIFISNTTEGNETYNISAKISFTEPCHINGKLPYYKLNLIGSRPHYADHKGLINKSDAGSFVFNLKPEYDYNVSITTLNERFSNTSASRSFKAPAGVPKFSNSTPIDLIHIEKGTLSASITLTNKNFDEVNGNIQHVAVIVFEKDVVGGTFSSWDGQNWPLRAGDDGMVYYQLLNRWWHPDKGVSNKTITIGHETNCTKKAHCNKPLKKNKDYYLVIRIFTRKFYKNSFSIHFRTDDVNNLETILFTIIGILVFALLGLAGLFVWKQSNITKLPPLFFLRKSSTKLTEITSIPIYKFMQYCKNLENHPEVLTEQYTVLNKKTKEVVRMQTTVYGKLTENKRKNRYTNIIPYDETRVKLLIDEDDEICSDYINASYIRGYSGKVEYIATQGPLSTTYRDFWKMVIQENVSIIVMVAQFFEQSREKCYKYFPNNHENMLIGEDMEVKCCMELQFGTYCIRTIEIRKDTIQKTVAHVQYLDWPDFDIPKSSDNVLQFCNQIRERLRMEAGCVVVHCSAGVGRTGTLIAADILLQNVKDGKNIDVFKTVLELRKQRSHMVQTQKQYMYIYNLIKDYFDQSLIGHENPIYENLLSVKEKIENDTLIPKEVEEQETEESLL